MKRRDFLKNIGLGAVALKVVGLPALIPEPPKTMVYHVKDIRFFLNGIEIGGFGELKQEEEIWVTCRLPGESDAELRERMKISVQV